MFQTTWYPQKGAKLTCTVSNSDTYLNCGSFTIDSTKFLYTPNGEEIEIRAIAATTNLPLRTIRSDYYEKTTIPAIAKKIADRHNMEFYTNEDMNSDKLLVVERITQLEQTDLAFLRQLSKDYGYIFKVTDNLITFINKEERETSYILGKEDFRVFSAEDNSIKKYKGGQINYYDPMKKELQTVSIGDQSGDILKLRRKFYTKEEGRQILSSLLSNEQTEVEAEVVLKEYRGDFISGIYFMLNGFGVYNGKYKIVKSTHDISSKGWYVQGTIQKIENIDPNIPVSQSLEFV